MNPEQQVAGIKLLACDVDGVLTDGTIIYGSGNLELKAFNIKDGIAMKLAWSAKFPVVWITGRRSEAVSRRADELNVHVYQGMGDKNAALRAVADEYGMHPEEIAYVGDDLNDIPAMCIAGFPVAVADAAAEVIDLAAYVTRAPGGRGAIREVIELIFKAQGRWEGAIASYQSHLRGASSLPNPQ